MKINTLEQLADLVGLCMSELMSTKELDLSNMNIESLPDSFGGLSSLEILSLQNNRLTHLPDSVNILKNRGCSVYL